MKKFLVLLCALAALGLAGCNKSGSNQNSTDLRALNAVVDAEPLDILVDDDVKFPALAPNTASGFVNFNSGTRDVKLRSSTTQQVLVDSSLGFSSGIRNTLLLFGHRTAIGSLLLPEDGTTPASGKTRVRVVNLSPDSGTVDMYLTATDISSGPAIIGGAVYGAASGVVEVNSGSYKIIFTATGTQDVLFTSPSAYTFNAGSQTTVVVMPSGGGKLTNGAVIEQGSNGTVTFFSNPQARVKVVNGITDIPAVNYKLNGTVLFSNVPFTGASSYLTVASGSQTMTAEASNVPGTAIASRTQTLTAGRDFTYLTLGTTASPSMTVLADDNALPATGLAKLRFVNALVDGTTVDVLVNFGTQTTGIARGTASTYSSIAAGINYTLSFTTPGGVSVLASIPNVELDSPFVYSVYLFGTLASPQAKLVRDR